MGWRKMAATVAVALIAGVGLTGCGGSGSDDAASRAVPVSPKLMGLIASEPKGVEITPVDAVAVRSHDFANTVYFVAMSFDAPGGGTETGVWATTDLTPGAPIFAVDGMARSFTNWRDAAEKGISYPADDGIAEAKDALEAS